MNKHILHVTLLAIIFCCQNSPAQAQEQGIFEQWFPELFKEESPDQDPAKTLIAPFADSEKPTKKTTTSSNTIPKWQHEGLTNDTTKPHLTPEQVANWLSLATANAMSFSTNNYLKETQQKSQYFTEQGWKEYTKFLEDTNINNAIKSDQYNVSTFINDTPFLLNQGQLGSQYKWLYDVKAMITYKDPNINDYTNKEPITQYLKIRTQITRVPDTPNSEKILIEQWRGTLHASPED